MADTFANLFTKPFIYFQAGDDPPVRHNADTGHFETDASGDWQPFVPTQEELGAYVEVPAPQA